MFILKVIVITFISCAVTKASSNINKNGGGIMSRFHLRNIEFQDGGSSHYNDDDGVRRRRRTSATTWKRQRRSTTVGQVTIVDKLNEVRRSIGASDMYFTVCFFLLYCFNIISIINILMFLLICVLQCAI